MPPSRDVIFESENCVFFTIFIAFLKPTMNGLDNTAATLTSTELLSEEVRHELNAIFDWNPVHLRPAPPMLPSRSRRRATGTHQPSFFDGHFSGDLILRQVKRLPSLVPDLANNVDRTLRAAEATLPCTWDLLTAAQRKRPLDNVAKDEKAVIKAYMKTTPTFCEPVASTLTLHPKASTSGWSSLISWSTSVHPSMYAIANGQLQFKFNSNVEDAARLLNTMDSDTRKIVEKLRDAESPLGTWDFKSITTGSDEVMQAVGTLGKFSWTGCNLKSSEGCSGSKHRIWTNTARNTVVGPDARDPPWNLTVCAFAQHWKALLIIPQELSADTTLPTPLTVPSVQLQPGRVGGGATASYASTSSVPPARRKVPATASRVTKKRKLKVYVELPQRQSYQTRDKAAPPPAPTSSALHAHKKVLAAASRVTKKGKHKESTWTRGTTKTRKRKRGHSKDDDNDDDEDEDEDNNNEKGDGHDNGAYKDRDDLTAQSLVQHVNRNIVAHIK